jgi:hypothetical protein
MVPAMWVPKHIFCVVGNWTSFDQVRNAVQLASDDSFLVDEEFSILEADPRMTESFESCRDRARPTWSDADRAAVANHTAVVYVMSPPVLAEQSIELSTVALRTIAAVLRAGGTAAKSESAGIAHGYTTWLQLADEATKSSQSQTRSTAEVLRDAFVRLPLLDTDDDTYYSCGMHLLGARDLEMPAELDAKESIRWFDRVSEFVLRTAAAKNPQDRPVYLDEDVRFIADGGPCMRYPQDSFFYNPYGYWSLLEGEEDQEAALTN